jgi:hypothetical protein
MVSHQELDQFGVALPKSDRCDGVAGDRRPPIRVMRAGPGQLADVVEEAGQQQDVGPIHLSEMPLRLRDGLHQVPVDCMTVDRIVLGPSADRLPGRDPPADTAREVERLPHRHDI